MKTWKVGDLAKISGLSIRALHFYEEAGLLRPSTRTDSKHRLYNEKDVVRVQQILSLKQLGLPLETIKKCLVENKMSPLEVIQMHLARIKEERTRIENIFRVLTTLEKALVSKKATSITDFINLMEVIKMNDKYFSKEQLEELGKRRDKLGEKKIQSIQEEWPKLIEKVRVEMKKGTAPNDPEVQKLAKRWNELVEAFAGKNAEIRMKLVDMYKKEPAVRQRSGIDDELNEYVGKMMYCWNLKK